jgi:hypothetical protein
MLVFTGERDDLCGLSIRLVVRILTAFSPSFNVDAKHKIGCIISVHLEDVLQNIDDKLYWSLSSFSSKTL